jgi:hypothetical protein
METKNAISSTSSSSKGGTFLPSWLSLGRTDHGGSGKKLSSFKSSGTSGMEDGPRGSVPMPIVIGVIAPRAEKKYLEETCQRLNRLAPDRIDIRHLTSDVVAATAAAAETAVVALHVLVLCASKPNFPHELAQQ